MKDKVERCAQCARPAKWFWPGSSYDGPMYLCGYHKRAYLHTYKLLTKEPTE